MKKILFITKTSGGTASARVRVNSLIPELEKRGFSTKTVRFPKNFRDKWSLLRLCAQFDVVYIQKRTPPLLYARLLRGAAKQLVYDFDDAVYFKPNSPDESKNRRRYRLFKNIAQKADMVIAGNSVLAEEARQHNANCRVLPSAVETRNIPVKDYSVSNDKFVIGWVGNESNLVCLKPLVPAFQRLADRHAIQVRIISSKAVEIPGVDIRLTRWNEKTQEAEIACFDVGIMPLYDYPNSRGKCAYKALQYMAAGVPAVVSDVGVNREVVEHGVCGYVVRDLDHFDDYLERLIMDRNLIARMGVAAKARVDAQFSIERVGEELAEFLR